MKYLIPDKIIFKDLLNIVWSLKYEEEEIVASFF